MPPDWPDYMRFRDALIGLLDPRLYPVQWLDGEIWSGRLKLFADEKSCILTSFKVYPTGVKECHVEGAAGELGHLIGPAIRRVEQWASEHGCSIVSIQSRAGWQKIMKSQGYNLHQTTIRKEI